jgi:uncharacterized protein YqfA (UPF0365 family)
MAHGEDSDVDRSVQVAIAAQMASLGLDEERSKFYCDLAAASVEELDAIGERLLTAHSLPEALGKD